MAVSTRTAKKSKTPTKAAAKSSSKKSSRRRRNNKKKKAAAVKDDSSIVSDGADSSSSNKILISARENEFNERTWWMVDIMYDDEEGNSTTQGATALVKRCMRVYNWSIEKTRKVLTAYRQFLTLKKKHKDWNATILSPSYLVDQMWHQHILDAVNYTHDMMLLCGHFVGHNPEGALDLQKKAKRDKATRKALEKRFANKYDKEVWGILEIKKEQDINHNLSGVITIRVKGQSDEPALEFKVFRSIKMGRIFQLYAEQRRLDVNLLRFILDSDRIGETDTPSSLELEDGDQIYAFMAQRGC